MLHNDSCTARTVQITYFVCITFIVISPKKFRPIEATITLHRQQKFNHATIYCIMYRGADKSLARPTSQCILFDGENISFDASLVIYINSTNIPQIMIINRIYENQNLLSL